MDAVILQSFGAAETVTGSKHLLRTPEVNKFKKKPIQMNLPLPFE